MKEARFDVVVPVDAPLEFARLSGDWNKLHTDAGYAATTPFGRPVLHGAFLVGLLSRLAGMHLPGAACLLHGVSLRFITPVLPPVTLTVVGEVAEGSEQRGRVAVRIVDAKDGTRYADGHYDFGLHETRAQSAPGSAKPAARAPGLEAVLVTGASGDLAKAVMARLGQRGIGASRSGSGPHVVQARSPDELEERLGTTRLAGIVHCAWPHPDNEALTELIDVGAAIEYHVAAPLREMISLAQLLRKRGTENSVLILVGSTAAEPGRHNYRMPLYSLAKSLVPNVARILATELAVGRQRCVAVVFDVIAGGMNQQMSAAARISHKDRSPFGRIASLEEAAHQVAWTLDNGSFLSSGATIVLTGAAAP